MNLEIALGIIFDSVDFSREHSGLFYQNSALGSGQINLVKLICLLSLAMMGTKVGASKEFISSIKGADHDSGNAKKLVQAGHLKGIGRARYNCEFLRALLSNLDWDDDQDLVSFSVVS